MAKDYDPRMHSAEHILNQTMVRMFNRGRSFSAHIERKKSKCDYYFDRDLTTEEVLDIESRVNGVIKSGAAVRQEILSKAYAEKEFNLSRLPDENEQDVRIIRIGDYDSCPCSGQHVTDTSEIGTFQIASTSYDNGVLRIRFKLSD